PIRVSRTLGARPFALHRPAAIGRCADGAAAYPQRRVACPSREDGHRTRDPGSPNAYFCYRRDTNPSSDFLEYSVRSAVHGELLRSMVSRAVRHGGLASLQRAWIEEGCRAPSCGGWCTAHEIAAITGHASLNEVQRYTRAADQQKLAASAMEKTRTFSG